MAFDETQMRNSKQDLYEVYADTLTRQNLAYYQGLAAAVQQAANQPATVPATTTTTPKASGLPNLQSYLPMIALGGGALLLLWVFKR